MKFKCSYTSINGLTVSLSVSAPFSFYEPLSGISEGPLADQDLVSSAFEQAIPELSRQLLPMHDQCELALLGSYTKHLGVQLSNQEEAA